MNNVDIHVVRFLQRTIELLAFYLILANIDGNDLKDSFVQLVKTKQKKLYGNVVLLIVYLFGITYLLHIMPIMEHGLLIDHIFRPFLAFFLLRRVFSVKKALLTYLFSMSVAFTVGMVALAFSLYTYPIHGLLVFVLVLLVVLLVSYRNDFENIYMRLLKNHRLFNAVSVASFIVYLVLFFTTKEPSIKFLIICALLMLLLLFITIIYLRKEIRRIVNQLQNASADEFPALLKELSEEYHTAPNLMNQYIIRNYNFMELYPPLSKELAVHRILGTFKDYECILTRRQIKINVIL